MFMSRSYGKPFVTKLIEASVRLKGHILKVKRSHPKGICRWAWPDPQRRVDATPHVRCHIVRLKGHIVRLKGHIQ